MKGDGTLPVGREKPTNDLERARDAPYRANRASTARPAGPGAIAAMALAASAAGR